MKRMTRPYSRLRRWLLFVLLCMVGVALPVAIVYWQHTVPLSECSEVYRQYYKTPGIRAAYIQDMTVDDTIHFDMTLLLCDNTTTYYQVLRDLGRSNKYLHDVKEYMADGKEHILTGWYNDDILCDLPDKKTVAILHPVRPEDKVALTIKSLKKQIKISQNETNN